MTGVQEIIPKSFELYKPTLGGKVAKAMDDTIFALAPQWGQNRRNARLRSVIRDQLGVSWTQSNANRNWLATGFSIDNVLWNDLPELQNRCAEAYRTNNVAHAAVEARVVNEVGAGIRAQAQVRKPGSMERDPNINLELEKSLALWSKHGVDVQRASNLYQFQRLMCRSLGIFGEAIILFSETPSKSGITLACELISPERLSTPEGRETDEYVRMGVEYNRNWTIKGYWIRTMHPGDRLNYQYKWEFYPRMDEQGRPRVVHVFERLFAEQSRGIPWLASSLDRIKDLDDWYEAELIAKQVEACFGVIFTGGENSASPYARANAEAKGDRIEELHPGLIHYAAEGETATTIDPQRPGATFAPFVEQTLRSIASTINLPYEILAKNFFRTTFSSGQLAMLDGRHGFRTRREVLIEGGLVPLWDRFVNDAAFNDEIGGTISLTDYVANPEAYHACVWTPPGWGFINPRDEVRAAGEALDYNLTTLSALYSERGEDADTQLRKRQEEKLQEIKDDVEQRKLKWELEEQAGLPHAEEPAETNEEDEDADNSAASEEDAIEESQEQSAG